MTQDANMRVLSQFVVAASAFILPCVVSAEATPQHVPAGVAVKALSTKVMPLYPPVAKQLKIGGVVQLEATISEDGSVEQVRIVSGNPILTKAAATAVEQRKFTPFQEDGQPARAVAGFGIGFSLADARVSIKE